MMARPRALVDLRLIGIKDAILDSAARLSPPTLDAIHPASALSLEDSLTAVVTYDARMITATAALGIPIATPG